jgi:hypothetical protein
VTRASDIDDDGLFSALVLVPKVFSRNRFFWLFEEPRRRRLRRRAARVRGIVRLRTAPAPLRGEIVGEQVLKDGRVLIRYRVEDLGFSRTASLSALEAAVLRYALHRAGVAELDPEDRRRVEAAVITLTRELGVELDGVTA